MDKLDFKRIKSTFIKSGNRQLAGMDCLASIIKYYGGSTSFSQLKQNSGATIKDVNLLGLCKAAREEGFDANGYKGTIGLLKGLEVPVILYIERDNGLQDFIVVYGWHDNKFIIGDCHWGIIEYREDELGAVWKSKALLFLEPNNSFQNSKKKKLLKRKWFWGIIKNYNRLLLFTGLLGVLSAVVLIVSLPFFTGQLNELVLAPDIKQFIKGSLIVLSLIVAVAALIHIQKVLLIRGTKGFVNWFNNHLVRASFTSVSGLEGLSGVYPLTKSISQFCHSVFKLVSGTSLFVPLVLAALINVSFTSIRIGTIFLTISLVLVVMVWFRSKKAGLFYGLNYNCKKKISETLSTNNNNFKLIKLTNNETYFALATGTILQFGIETKMKLKNEGAVINRYFIFAMIPMFLCFIIEVWLAGTNNKHIINLTGLSWALVYSMALYRIIKLALDYNATGTLFDFLYDKLEGYDFSSKKADKNPGIDIGPIRKLAVRKLSFAFPGKLPVFQGVSFEAKKGAVTIIYGETGSGKSIISSVLGRFLGAETGRIMVNDKDWNIVGDGQWRKSISSVLQPVQLFDSSVFENISLADQSQKPENVMSFCKEKGFDQFIEKLPDSYFSSSNRISEGEKQLVALAAALFRKPKVLILDEPFSSMDEKMEGFCWDLLQELKSEILIILFTNNKQRLKKSDNIFSLGDKEAILKQ